jgi:ATP-dependent protease ClpP protease subunit
MSAQPGLRAVNLQKVRLLERLASLKPELANEIRNTKLDWYRIKNTVATEETDTEAAIAPLAEVYIYDEIGGSFGVSATDFINAINEIDAPTITVRINSPGGLLIDAIAIANTLEQHPAHIVTRVDGIAASAASLIAVAGDTCEMMNGSQLMIHDAMCGPMGNARTLRDAADWLDEQSDNIANMYAKKSGGDPGEWRTRMLDETWMFAEEAVNLGLMDSVYVRNKNGTAEPEAALDEPEEEEPENEAEVMNKLLTRPHRLTNRGYKYLGRNKAPAPQRVTESFADLVDSWR